MCRFRVDLFVARSNSRPPQFSTHPRAGAPELLLRAPRPGPPADVFALGCVAGEALAGGPLFPGASELDQLARLRAALLPPGRREEAGGCGVVSADAAMDTGAGGGAGGRSARFEGAPGALAAMLAALPPAAADLVARMLAWDAAARPTAEEALAHPFLAAAAAEDGEGAGVAAAAAAPPLAAGTGALRARLLSAAAAAKAAGEGGDALAARRCSARSERMGARRRRGGAEPPLKGSAAAPRAAVDVRAYS
jgi:hypothetical protein